MWISDDEGEKEKAACSDNRLIMDSSGIDGYFTCIHKTGHDIVQLKGTVPEAFTGWVNNGHDMLTYPCHGQTTIG